MFNLGLPELLVVGAVLLLFFGPKRLPELAKGLGKGIRDFKKALDGSNEEDGQKLPPEHGPTTTQSAEKEPVSKSDKNKG